jgi:hypothetical protein
MQDGSIYVGNGSGPAAQTFLVEYSGEEEPCSFTLYAQGNSSDTRMLCEVSAIQAKCICPEWPNGIWACSERPVSTRITRFKLSSKGLAAMYRPGVIGWVDKNTSRVAWGIEALNTSVRAGYRNITSLVFIPAAAGRRVAASQLTCSADKAHSRH